jgi:dienelactone hydrolase
VLACTGARDPLVPLDDVDAFSREMDGAGADWQLIVYGRALHSFTNLQCRRRRRSAHGL